ncbi:ABC transporter permease [Puia sp. P3]|uniref:ABC transporter permease n=1 Tax=Puia sp. P3 TaxID=3423952 RepID=UPI003D67AFBC
MLKNYIRIAWRNILRHKVYAGINVFGLALGMTCCLFIFLWVQDERSVDSNYPKEKNLYTVYMTSAADGHVEGGYNTPISFNREKNTGIRAGGDGGVGAGCAKYRLLCDGLRASLGTS